MRRVCGGGRWVGRAEVALGSRWFLDLQRIFAPFFKAATHTHRRPAMLGEREERKSEGSKGESHKSKGVNEHGIITAGINHSNFRPRSHPVPSIWSTRSTIGSM